MHMTLTTPHAGDLILNLRDYPAWVLFLNHQPDLARESRADGLIAIAVPAGTSTVDVRYAHTRDQTIGNTISLLALGLLLAAVRRRKDSKAELANA
jgi:hypothetical protein